MGVDLPGADGVAAAELVHGRELCGEAPECGQRLTLDQEPLVATQRVGNAAGAFHVGSGERVGITGDRDRRDHSYVRVAFEEGQVEKVVDREAIARIGFATARLRKARAEVQGARMRGEIEEVRLDVDDCLRTPERVARGSGLSR